METQKLYYQDPYLREFPATVLSCESAGEAWKVVLDQTAFYPEGGGQPADHGVLKTAGGEIPVTGVHEKNGAVVHTCAASVEPGTVVTGILDWARRFDHMQQHSGEHILSGILCRLYHCDNVGFHLGAEAVTIDYNADITWEQALEAERLANAAVWADRETEIFYPSSEELAALDYRSKKELTGRVRIVEFPEADRCACCGTHVERAGQAGPIKVLSCQKFREGVRMEILCGARALRYLSTAYDQARAVGQRLSVKPLEIQGAVERLEEELSAAKVRMADLEQTAFAALAAGQAGRGDVLLFQSPMRPDSLRRLADAVGKSCGGLAAVFSGEGAKWSYALVRGDGGDIAPLVKELNETLHGRGGGRNGFAQGSVQAGRGEIEAFFRR
ncbi:MAG: alanyl-tRNA editing protein [Oscillibacter sp.]|uniref:alanyl-tRNA editing protein n=1 Tax=Oscillibacter sp. TaxID=1945593 RepID=UPI00216F618A|nr:alanine--tRNA ligase-related protein [Oscillibacter sp.]MCI8842052.1 alanyl-tRNA editing protein [Oscillibacter sp.]MCI9114356.1 alanyl-tRNA editing protein [Oscillibacter sp.]